MYAVLLLICDPVLKDQVCNNEDYEQTDNNQGTLKLLRCIKIIMCSKGDYNTHMGYNQDLAMSKYYHVQQE